MNDEVVVDQLLNESMDMCFANAYSHKKTKAFVHGK